MVLLSWKTVAAVKACSDCPDSREVLPRWSRGCFVDGVNLQRRHGTTLASGFALEYSVHALDVSAWLQ
jgi:hypothetical protein